jgi:hypothetical protein
MSNYIYTVNGEYKKIKKDDVIETLFNFDISTNGRCGPRNGKKRCPGNQCCSSSGWCGGTKGKYSSHCYRLGKGAFWGLYDGQN